MTSLRERLEPRMAALLLRLPEPVLHRLAGGPLEIDGRTLDPRIRLAAKEAATKPSLADVSLEHARRGANQSLAEGNGARAAGVRVDDMTTPDGLPVRVYRNGLAIADTPPLNPGMLFMHQGGFVIGDLDTCDSFCSRVASELGVVVVSLDYRLAPEHKFPAQLEDAQAAWDWIQNAGEELGIDPKRVAVAGDSAGGHLSALLSQRLRKAGAVPPVVQLLVYPFVDGLAAGGSMESCAKAFPLSRATMKWFADQYLTADIDVSSSDFSPMHGALVDLAPAIVVTAGFDPLRDQGIAYADALRHAGNDVTSRCEDSLSHSFLSMGGPVPEAYDAQSRIIKDLQRFVRI